MIELWGCFGFFPFDAVNNGFQISGCFSHFTGIVMSIELAIDDAALESCIAGVLPLPAWYTT